MKELADIIAKPSVHLSALAILGMSLIGFGSVERAAYNQGPQLKEVYASDITAITNNTNSVSGHHEEQVRFAVQEYTRSIEDYNKNQIKLYEMHGPDEIRHTVAYGPASAIMFAGIGCLIAMGMLGNKTYA